jgi:hypothetical protein
MSLRARGAAACGLIVVLAIAAGCGRGGGGLFGKQYEYEEEIFLDLDGSATITVNASLASLATLRGLDVPYGPDAEVDRDRIRALFSSPVAEVTHVSRAWRRDGRTFVQVELDVPDIRRLPEAAPFAWSTYSLTPVEEEGVEFRQRVGASAFTPGTLKNVGWSGKELVAFRVHLPSRIRYHNARDVDTNQTLQHERGNILRWEQYLNDRLDGTPVELEVRMDGQSILYTTLWLFAGAFAAALALLASLVWWTFRRGAKQEGATTPPA